MTAVGLYTPKTVRRVSQISPMVAYACTAARMWGIRFSLGLAATSFITGDPDSVQIFEVTERRVEPAGDPATFAGPVVALWPSGRKGEAVAIARSSETGRYAAYSLAVTCDR